MLRCTIFRQLVSQRHCKTRCSENCSVTVIISCCNADCVSAVLNFWYVFLFFLLFLQSPCKLCAIYSFWPYCPYKRTPPNISLSSTDNRAWLHFILSFSPQSPSCVLPVLPGRVVFRPHLRLHPSRPQQIHQSWRPSEGPVWSDIHSLHHVLHRDGNGPDGKVSS